MSDRETPFSTRAEILADLWLNYRNDEEFQDFIEYNDIGLPLAYAISNDLVKTTDIATKFVNETFDLFVEALDYGVDSGWSDLDSMLSGKDD
jgi:hypothetical protein